MTHHLCPVAAFGQNLVSKRSLHASRMATRRWVVGPTPALSKTTCTMNTEFRKMQPPS
ncbi:peptidase dimerization domain protein [Anopheles sinensis]|uniref:Peptidase dimerization domain protein n=1 Tax=Anopheles sinensis TaxID=74873 RepID=A0A084WMF6_ANOSI|nr:peptidase dimerization domain protein [Anopheles sinensis]